MIGAGAGFQSDGASLIGRSDAVRTSWPARVRPECGGQQSGLQLCAWLGTTRQYAVRLLRLLAVTVRLRAVCARADPPLGCGAGRAAAADVRAIVALCADQSVAPVRYSIALECGGRSSLAERCNRPLQLPRSHPDGRYVRRTGSSEKAPAARAATMVVLRRTWPRLAVWWCRECGYQPRERNRSRESIGARERS